MDRKYSVAEIDRMRVALQRRFGFGGPWVVYSAAGPAEQLNKLRSEPYDRDVEDKLRTYMLAGVDPADLEAAAVHPSNSAQTDATPTGIMPS